MIDKNIRNVREKVDMLQMYGPKLLKKCEQGERPTRSYTPIDTGKNDKNITTHDVMDVAFSIVRSLVMYTAHGNQFVEKGDEDLTLGKGSVKIEDLLQIFVDHHDLMT